MKFAHLGIATAFLLLGGLPMSLVADTWKCTYANGETQYTAVPPDSGADCQLIRISKTMGATPSQAQPAPSPPPAPTAATAATNPQPPARNADIERINRENCERAQANLTLLSSSTRIRLKEGDEYRVIPEEERQEKMRLAQEQIDTYCK